VQNTNVITDDPSGKTVSITGNTVITVGGEATTLVAGQSTSITATALIDDVIVINSASGTFLATTLS
jgi:hypothetical protein